MPAESVFGDAAGECAAPATFPKNRNKHAHVPREEWRRLHPKPAVSGNEDTGDFGSHGGPRRPREVLGIERSQTQLDAANSGNLQLWGLPSVESYFELEDARLRSIQELDVFMRDGKNSPRNKHHECAKHHMKWGRSTHNCGECWLMKGNCVCSELTNCTPKIAPHRVVAYVHHLEFGRGNSSGCLIKRCLGGELLVAGLKEHEEKLQKICHENKGRIAVLWPRGTVEFGEILASVGGMERGAGGIDISAGSAGEDTCDSSPRDTPCDSPGRETPCDSSGRDTPSSNSPKTSNSGWTFIAVDATWNCARKMVKRIPANVPRVGVPPEAFELLAKKTPPLPEHDSLLGPVRKYDTRNEPNSEKEGRRSTFEAVVALLLSLDLASETACESLLKNVKVKVNGVLAQKKMPPAYLLPDTATGLLGAGGALVTEFTAAKVESGG